MTIYERLYYNLCQPAFSKGKLASNWLDQRRFRAARYFFVMGHAVYGAVVALGLVILYQQYIGAFSASGWLVAGGVAASLLLLAYFIPSQARLEQLERGERSHSPIRRFVEMLTVYTFFMGAIFLGFVLFMAQMSYLATGCIFCN